MAAHASEVHKSSAVPARLAANTVPPCITSSSKSVVRLTIFAKPGARNSQITEISADAIAVQIAAPPRYFPYFVAVTLQLLMCWLIF